MLDVKQKQFIIIFALIALIACSGTLFFLWQEALSNKEIIKNNCISELVSCGCIEGVKTKALNNVDTNLLHGFSAKE